MRRPFRSEDIAPRVATGGFILHSGLQKAAPDAERAKGLHGMASGAYPFLKDIPPERFAKLLSTSEIALGAALLAPFVPTAVAGAGLTAFAAGLLGMYARTPGMREEGSIWPTHEGLTVFKDVWMLGTGLGFVTRALTRGR